MTVIFFVSGHAYNAHDRCICSGYDNGDIKLFDLRNMSLRWETNVKNGVSLSLKIKKKKKIVDASILTSGKIFKETTPKNICYKVL